MSQKCILQWRKDGWGYDTTAVYGPETHEPPVPGASLELFSKTESILVYWLHYSEPYPYIDETGRPAIGYNHIQELSSDWGEWQSRGRKHVKEVDGEYVRFLRDIDMHCWVIEVRDFVHLAEIMDTGWRLIKEPFGFILEKDIDEFAS